MAWRAAAAPKTRHSVSEFEPKPVRSVDPDAGRLSGRIDYNREGQLRGVLGAHIYWHWASSVMDVVRPPKAAETGLEILIVNKDDHVIFPEREDLQQPVPPALSKPRTAPLTVSSSGAMATPT